MTNSAAKPPREFWLCGEPNDLDVGVWYDHHPGVDVVYGKEFHRHHVIEFSAYQALLAERNELEHKLDQAVEALSAPCEECELLKFSETNWKQRQIKLALDHEALKAQAEALVKMVESLFCDPDGSAAFMGSAGDKKYFNETLTAWRKFREGK